MFISEEELQRKIKIMRSIKHDIYSIEINKIPLSLKDDKRIIGKDKVNTLAIGHKNAEF